MAAAISSLFLIFGLMTLIMRTISPTAKAIKTTPKEIKRAFEAAGLPIGINIKITPIATKTPKRIHRKTRPTLSLVALE